MPGNVEEEKGLNDLQHYEKLQALELGLLSKKVYYLTGEDVVDSLDRRGQLKQLTNEQVAQLIDYVEKKLDLSWEEALGNLLDSRGAQIIMGGSPQAVIESLISGNHQTVLQNDNSIVAKVRLAQSKAVKKQISEEKKHGISRE